MYQIRNSKHEVRDNIEIQIHKTRESINRLHSLKVLIVAELLFVSRYLLRGLG
jgi:hypothetical protein